MWALAARPVSFNLSTNRSFAPTEKPTLHLYAQNVDELEFRIYRVQNPGKFLAGLPDLHSFDNGTPWGPKERIDERTWLEKFHDWKHDLWFQLRRFFRGQFTSREPGPAAGQASRPGPPQPHRRRGRVCPDPIAERSPAGRPLAAGAAANLRLRFAGTAHRPAALRPLPHRSNRRPLQGLYRC